MPKEHDKELKNLSSEYEFYEIDLKNYEQIEKLVKKLLSNMVESMLL